MSEADLLRSTDNHGPATPVETDRASEEKASPCRRVGPAPGLARFWVLGAAMLLAVIGWRLFWFQTDDAYITFRYVSNLLAGYGLVWNPPPFLPVEGYTSLLWALLLGAAWRLTGLDPPRTACWLSLLCGLGTLALAWRAIGRLRLSPPLDRRRTLLAALALLGICTNRTFLTWLSSGLETQLWNLCFTWWLLEALGLLGEENSPAWGLRLSTAAALSCLARPDGLLTVPATVLLARISHAGSSRGAANGPGSKAREGRTPEAYSKYVEVVRPSATPETGPFPEPQQKRYEKCGLELAAARSSARPVRAAVLTASPLLAVAAHLLWRRWTYGAWLPNTYYAKVPAPWPEMGWRYLASFVVENGIWVWLALAVAAASRALLSSRRGPSGRPRRPAAARLAMAIAPAVVAAHVLYYTLIVGGDHFEYRVFSYLVPLLFVSALALIDAAGMGAAAAAATLGVFLLASWPLPWLHWWHTKDLATREQTSFLRWPLAGDFPAPMRPVVAAWDGWQATLIGHAIGVRHQEHKICLAWMSGRLPSRQQGARVAWSGRPVMATDGVGLVGWVLPHVAIVDRLGLNDRVIARTPLPASGRSGIMAHERRPPPGYVECFMPNVHVHEREVRVRPRPVPLNDDRIRACERRDWLRLRNPAAKPADR
jgi:arabinofuranosyltransferase